MRVGLIGCSAAKLDRPALARDLYQGALFRLAVPWIEARTDAWAILSARHGLVMPDQVVAPYDLSLASLSILERRAWAESAAAQVAAAWAPDATVYMVLAGADYRAAVAGFPMVEDPIRHWTELRRLRGMRRPQMGIGVIKKYLREGAGYY